MDQAYHHNLSYPDQRGKDLEDIHLTCVQDPVRAIGHIAVNHSSRKTSLVFSGSFQSYTYTLDFDVASTLRVDIGWGYV